MATRSKKQEEVPESNAVTGIDGLDNILGGGFAPGRLYLIEGRPGSGKTTLALQFLREGIRQGEAVLYITLSETSDELISVGQSHDWDLRNLPIHEIIPSEESLQPEQQYTMFHPSEVELSETSNAIVAVVERIKPRRVVFDSLSEMRLLSGSQLRYRRQILALKQYFIGRDCTVLLLDDQTLSDVDMQLQSIAHGVILLEQVHPEYGSERRRLRVVKFRGRSFRGGYHDFLIRRGGLEVYPRLVAAEHRQEAATGRFKSNIKELDTLLGGGVDRGTSTLLIGSAGTGKSTIAAQFASAAADRGERSAMFIFDEGINTLLTRTDGLGMSLRKHYEADRIAIRQIDPTEMPPGEFINLIRTEVETRGARLVVIDSLNGYLNAMPGERHLTIQLHELLAYLGQRGVATLMLSAQQGLIGSQMQAPVDASYLADSIIVMRYFEAHGQIRQAISVVKKRGGSHERTIREFSLDNGKIQVGEPLRAFRGVLTGVPVYEGESETLVTKRST